MPKTRKHLLVLFIAAALPLAAAAPAGAAPSGHGFPNKCGDGLQNGSGWFNLKAYNTACRVARKAADAYVFTAGGPEGWNCRQEQIGDEVWRANCIRSKDGRHQHIRFKFGA